MKTFFLKKGIYLWVKEKKTLTSALTTPSAVYYIPSRSGGHGQSPNANKYIYMYHVLRRAPQGDTSCASGSGTNDGSASMGERCTEERQDEEQPVTIANDGQERSRLDAISLLNQRIQGSGARLDGRRCARKRSMLYRSAQRSEPTRRLGNG